MKHPSWIFFKITISLILFIASNFIQPVPLSAFGNGDDKQQRYIEAYSKIAIQEMQRSSIPASITLAQGILESQWGEGGLASQSNNHFGIKCKKEWEGEKHFYKDDDRDENGDLIPSCFRVYDRVEDSYIDHTNFLVERKHYQELFELNPTDYKGWAHGLKKCGYATDPNYAKKLIKIIETYSLFIYDEEINEATVAQIQVEEPNEIIETPASNVFIYNEEPTEVVMDQKPVEIAVEMPNTKIRTTIELPAFNQVNHAAPGIERREENEMPSSVVNTNPTYNLLHRIGSKPHNGKPAKISNLPIPEISEIVSSGGRIQAMERKSAVKIRRR